MTGDIVFLLIFVILPTALIVSGFWLILFIRREPEVRVVERRAPARRRRPRETARVATVPDEPVTEIAPLPLPASDDGEPVATEPSRSGGEVERDQEAIEELSPLAADLLYGKAAAGEAMDIDDSRLIELLNPVDRELMEGRIGAGEDREPVSEKVERTEEIPEVTTTDDEEDVPAGATADLPEVREPADSDAEWMPRPDQPEARPPGEAKPEAAADQSGVEDEDADHSDKDELDGEDDTEPEAGPRQRHPRAKLLPTGEAERRRGRSSGRRVPRISRSSRRDEGGVESGDGPPDVASGYGERDI